MPDQLQPLSHNKVFDGWHHQFQHHSQVLGCNMRFAIFLPPQAQNQSVPLLFWLSGLTCTDENFMQKAGAFETAAKLGIAIVAPDTSPRGANVADDDAYDLGQGAGFYLNATQAPWAAHYRMYDYIVEELPNLLSQHFPLNGKFAISGHSMGGHGALMIGLKNPDRFTSISAFAPIVNPSQVPWGQKALSHYLGDNEQDWLAYDSCALLANSHQHLPILIDQGSADPFYSEQLQPEKLISIAEQMSYPIRFRMQPDFDHSYYFIQSFIAEHLHFHHAYLCQ
ncbi:S-formylglutathione hydrolase YeiG [Vibrio stylophorae]|uniref:S-formylglutathione hydrolase n=1 Tax=Vibrio stylophorae TaxID=659351 RepID=A0ABN8DRQ7_9VIBR|nr:S-formylglutathione hydrolase [Vibrio stylophorae]CAH0532879.1 S-formylglutathione hydrolase YeiG [Vibrio stylophorae]